MPDTDIISRKETVKGRLEGVALGLELTGKVESSGRCRDALELIEALEEKETAAGGLRVEVKKRTPETAGSYLVYSSLSRRVYPARWWPGNEREPGHWNQRSRGKYITHWMEMPEPPMPSHERK